MSQKLNLAKKNSTSVVTGAASGIGAATALELAKRGSNVALVDKNAEAMQSLAQKVEALGVKASVHVLDVSDFTAVEKFSQEIGNAHVLVNCAGVSILGSFRQISLEEFRWLIDINLWGTIAMTKYLLPVLEKQEAAHIANIGSVYSLAAPSGRAPYATSKFAVRGFTESLRHELQGSSVSVGIVLPGGVKTQIMKSARFAKALNPAVGQKAAAAQEAMYKTTPDTAAKIIVDGIEQRKGRVLVGTDAKIVDALTRISPVHYWNFLRGALAEAIKTE